MFILSASRAIVALVVTFCLVLNPLSLVAQEPAASQAESGSVASEDLKLSYTIVPPFSPIFLGLSASLFATGTVLALQDSSQTDVIAVGMSLLGGSLLFGIIGALVGGWDNDKVQMDVQSQLKTGYDQGDGNVPTISTSTTTVASRR